mmetsp:Transcript_10089/g.31994  ORF Transcript_10089/g.31994 Transcript_10089/m.31994 type:complete len:202 (+) Transcript_10089:619-1224(+)
MSCTSRIPLPLKRASSARTTARPHSWLTGRTRCAVPSSMPRTCRPPRSRRRHRRPRAASTSATLTRFIRSALGRPELRGVPPRLCVAGRRPTRPSQRSTNGLCQLATDAQVTPTPRWRFCAQRVVRRSTPLLRWTVETSPLSATVSRRRSSRSSLGARRLPRSRARTTTTSRLASLLHPVTCAGAPLHLMLALRTSPTTFF